MTTIVFLHIPKTAGQTIHHQLAHAVGPGNVSPIRTFSQVEGGPQFPAGYRLHSGHLDWTELESLPKERFVFSVLRDPKERIASFYFFVRREAEKLSPAALQAPENLGKQRILSCSAEEYFLGGSPGWQNFISDNYDNFYCSYFATARMRGHSELQGLSREDRLARAQAGAARLDAIYHLSQLDRLEADIYRLLRKRVQLVGKLSNHGANPDQARWPQLMALIGSQEARARLEGFAALDEALLARLGFASDMTAAI